MKPPAASIQLLASALVLLSRTATAAPLSAFTACQLEDPAHIGLVAAECAQLSVPENPADRAGRSINLRIARIGAINLRKQPDPLFILAGGPGMAATTFYASVAPAFERIRRERDIVLVDQRGTGGSNPLNCKLKDDQLYQPGAAAVLAEARRCLDELSRQAHVEFYTTSIAVRDLDAVRAALGYQRINLYGSSYGTRVAQHFARRFPDTTRALILDGVVPPQRVLGTSTALNAESALQRILERCAQEPPCHQQFGDPLESYREVRARLAQHSVAVRVQDPTSATSSQLEVTSFHLATVLRLSSYTSELAALLPLMLDDANHHGDFLPIATHFLFLTRSYSDVIAYGMHNSVVCSEDAPLYDTVKVDREQLSRTYLGANQLDGLRSICAIWPHGPVDSDFHQALTSAVPVLLLSGSDDPITPPADAELARAGLRNSRHLILQGFGHGQIAAACIDRVMARFVSAGSIAGLDAACTREDRPMPFFLSAGGPAP